MWPVNGRICVIPPCLVSAIHPVQIQPLGAVTEQCYATIFMVKPHFLFRGSGKALFNHSFVLQSCRSLHFIFNLRVCVTLFFFYLNPMLISRKPSTYIPIHASNTTFQNELAATQLAPIPVSLHVLVCKTIFNLFIFFNTALPSISLSDVYVSSSNVLISIQ